MKNPYIGIHALYTYLSDMVYIYLSNKWVNIGYRVGKIDERRELLSRYVLLKQARESNLSLTRFGFSRNKVDAYEFELLVKNCRKDTLRYLRHKRKESRDRS